MTRKPAWLPRVAASCRWHHLRSSPRPGVLIGTYEPLTLAQLAGITLVASAVQGAAGFGFTLLAVPFFLLILGSRDAVQLLIVINLAISLALAVRIRRDVARTLWVRLAVGAFVGLPVGLVVFQSVDLDQLKMLVAFVILAFVVLAVFGRPKPHVEQAGRSSGPVPALGIGALAGAMTTALGMPGPPVVLYLTAVGAGKDVLRSTTLAFFAVSYGLSLVLQAATVGIIRDIWVAAGLLVPVAAIGALMGHVSSRRVGETAFRRAVLVLIAATGVYMLLDTLLR